MRHHLKIINLRNLLWNMKTRRRKNIHRVSVLKNIVPIRNKDERKFFSSNIKISYKNILKIFSSERMIQKYLFSSTEIILSFSRK